MINFFLKKVIILLFSLFVVATLTFSLMQMVPGDPFTEERAIPEDVLRALRHHHGLDSPWHVQYWRYLKGLATLDLGPSFKYSGRTVTEIIREGLPVSMLLGLQALIVATAAGISLGCIGALKHRKWQDHLAMLLTVVAISIPSFILATLLQYLIAMRCALLPIARWGTFAHTILPCLSLAALPTAFIARLIRSTMIEVMGQEYIQTARSKGLSTFHIVFRHALRNAIFPVITYLGPLTASVLTGSFAVEKIFGIPGTGQWFVRSIINRDYTVIMGITVLYSALLMLCVFIADTLYYVLDPRIRSANGRLRIW